MRQEAFTSPKGRQETQGGGRRSTTEGHDTAREGNQKNKRAPGGRCQETAGMQAEGAAADSSKNTHVPLNVLYISLRTGKRTEQGSQSAHNCEGCGRWKKLQV